MTDNDLDLEGLTLSPEREAKESKRENRFGREIRGEVKFSKISSVNKDILCVEPAISIPQIFGWERTASAKGSKAKTKISGESGQP